jgi:N utilization substance protein B
VTDWPVHRQPVVDRNVLRLAVYEMHRGGVPHALAIDQAVELAREFGGERSPAFVNAVLDRWWKRHSGSA